MLERGDLTQKRDQKMGCFVESLRGGQGVHDVCSRISASNWEIKGESPGNCGNTSDGYFQGGDW